MRQLRRFVLLAAYTALLAASAWALNELAQWQLTAHLRDQAAHALALAARGESPHQWTFDGPESIVAGRVFGTAPFRFDGGELNVSSDGTPFDIGLPLPRALDLGLFPHLHIAASAGAPARLEIVACATLTSSAQVLATTTLAPGTASLDLHLPAAGAALQPRSGVRLNVAVLRLRFMLPAGAGLRLRSAELGRTPLAPRLDLDRPPRIVDAADVDADGSAIYRIAPGGAAQQIDIAAIASMYTTSGETLVLLPQRARVEQQIGLRNAVFATLPAAILIPERALQQTFAQARLEAAAPHQRMTHLRWYLLGGYALALLWSRLRPLRTPRARAASEAVLALAGPLWLVLGGQFDGKPDAFQLVLIALSVLYAVALSVPRDWNWNGSRQAWLAALGIVGVAALAGWLLHDPQQPMRAIGTAHVARYLGWALLQQFLICAVCTERWFACSGSRALAAYLGALGFALLHAPNAMLMLATLLGGLCWCALYLRERALLPLAFSHAASALLLLALVPRSILASAEVSARFFQ